nr:MAG TPA: hypothetical protein [Caudoviricetes sp.]
MKKTLIGCTCIIIFISDSFNTACQLIITS